MFVRRPEARDNLSTRPRRPLRNLGFALSLALVPVWGVGQLARDRAWLTGLCFYIPSAFLAVLLAGWALYHLAGRRRKSAALAAFFALPPLAIVLLIENHFGALRPAATASQSVRLVHWNVQDRLSAGARQALIAHRADVYVLSEIPGDEAVEFLRAALGGEYESQIFGNLAVIAAGHLRADGWLIDRQGLQVQALAWEHAGRETSLIVVDGPAAVIVSRDPWLRELNELIAERRPALVVGDFNAPRRSRALCELPAGYRHAYHSAGSGCGYTWPVPIPMYSLDHAIHSADIVPIRYELYSSLYSDHRRQVFDFAFAR
jgi:endonuclease/exonuclease/phosphatase (EEP) superfamily protein YafD